MEWKVLRFIENVLCRGGGELHIIVNATPFRINISYPFTIFCDVSVPFQVQCDTFSDIPRSCSISQCSRHQALNHFYPFQNTTRELPLTNDINVKNIYLYLKTVICFSELAFLWTVRCRLWSNIPANDEDSTWRRGGYILMTSPLSVIFVLTRNQRPGRRPCIICTLRLGSWLCQNTFTTLKKVSYSEYE